MNSYRLRHQIALPYVPRSERSTILNSSRILLYNMSQAKAEIFSSAQPEQDFANTQ